MAAKLQALSRLFSARLSKRIVLWVFASIIVAEVIVLIPSVARRKQEMLSQLTEVSDAMAGVMQHMTLRDAADAELLAQARQLLQSPSAFPGGSPSVPRREPGNEVGFAGLGGDRSIVLGGALYRADGQQVGVFGEPPELSVARVKEAGVRQLENPNSTRYDVAWSVPHSDRNYTLILRLDTSLVQQELYAYIGRVVGLVLIISAFVTVATIIVLEPTLITPILLLRSDLIKAGEAAFIDGQVIEFSSTRYQRHDELGEVIAAFNSMFQRVSEAITYRKQAEEKLAQLNAELETRVENSTSELKAANENLRQEIRQRQEIEEKLRYNAYHDTLTSLPNRALFMEHLGEEVARAKENSDYLFAVLFLDVDRLKVINDTQGHTFGDELLKAIATRLQNCLNPGEMLARFGGDEFVILLKNISDSSWATKVAEEIQQELAHTFILNTQDLLTSVSIGIALSSTGYNQPEHILRDADIAMYRAKTQGQLPYEVFDVAMHNSLVAQLQLENDLRRAVKNLGDGELGSSATAPPQFLIYYQPIVELKTGFITGFEALVRWQHPQMGFVSPVDFIPIAEATNLIIPLGGWILREACRQVVTWHQQFPHRAPLTMSVNLSVRQFARYELIADIDQILQETNLDGKLLKLEITESALMDGAELATTILLQLKARNIQLCMDDFGTGYSSLSYLHRFPLDILKIDQSFVRIMEVNAKNSAIVQTILTLADNLGMAVVAEGVETSAQLQKLQDLGCVLGQGYLFSRPVDSQKASQLLEGEGESGKGLKRSTVEVV